MAKKSFIEESKIGWYVGGADRPPTNEEIQVGALQRIAAATEEMAGNYIRMQNDLENYKKWYQAEREDNARLRKSLSAAKGWLKRYKNKVNE